MDITEFDIPLFSPNITEINFSIFDLWLRGYNEEEVLYVLQNSFYFDLKKSKKGEKNKNEEELHIKKITNEEKKGGKEKMPIGRAKDNVFFVKNRILNIFNTDNNDNNYNSRNIFFQHFLCLYIKQQFYIFNILSYHLMNLDLRFSNFYVPISKHKALKLIRIYYDIDFNLEKEIIKYKNINNINKYTSELVKVTSIHKISVKRQIENIKNLWKYIINIYEERNINIGKLQKKRRITLKKIVKYIKTHFRFSTCFSKRESFIDNDDGNCRNGSFLFKKKKKKRKGKGKKKGKMEDRYIQYNIIKTLENLIGIYLAKRYFRLYWIVVYHIEIPKKINIAYPYFNNIILLLLEKLEINDFILSKEYINISKDIYATYKNNKNMDTLKSKACVIADINNTQKSKVLTRLKCILNLLCCFRNSYELTKFISIFFELQKNEPLTNEKTFIKQNIGNNNFVNRIMCFIKEAENYSKIKKEEYEKIHEKNINV
ncbi:conserved Plasmodium protein, unknown function [Plasmodium sp. gorilla clade G3]|nr:conserved Plasmodium protein, unknown function [Plasmodium sp. gorilla clade G3]